MRISYILQIISRNTSQLFGEIVALECPSEMDFGRLVPQQKLQIDQSYLDASKGEECLLLFIFSVYIEYVARRSEWMMRI